MGGSHRTSERSTVSINEQDKRRKTSRRRRSLKLHAMLIITSGPLLSGQTKKKKTCCSTGSHVHAVRGSWGGVYYRRDTRLASNKANLMRSAWRMRLFLTSVILGKSVVVAIMTGRCLDLKFRCAVQRCVVCALVRKGQFLVAKGTQEEATRI